MTNPSQPGEFGKALRAAREKAGLDMRALSDLTKIQFRYIEALEREDWAAAPKGVHGRGFVKILAREIGADTEHLLALYQACRGEEPVLVVRPPPVESEWRMGAEDLRRLNLQRFLPQVSLRLVGWIAAVFLGLGLILWVWSPWAARPKPLPTAPAEEAAPPAAAEPAAVVEGHRLEVRALAPTRFRLEGEGLLGDPVDLGKGEAATFEVPGTVRVLLADPSTAEVTWDGTAVTLPPASGKKKEAAVDLPPAGETKAPSR